VEFEVLIGVEDEVWWIGVEEEEDGEEEEEGRG
jgi:hypothetical protein